MLNKVFLIGHLGQNPEIKHLEDGTPVGKLSIATTKRWNDANGQRQEKTTWHNIVVWRREATNANQYLKKGSKVHIEGELTNRKWQDSDGLTRSAIEVVANKLTYLDKLEKNGNLPTANDAPPAYKKVAKQQIANSFKPIAAAGDADMPVIGPQPGEDDLPF